MAKVTLDLETFKALASPTRLQVLKALDERRKTVTEISRDLDLNKATVHEHLQVLTATGLVKKRDDEGRKWIYYELSWQGERLLHPQESTTFAVLLGLGVLAAGGGAALFGQAIGWWWQDQPLQALEEDGSFEQRIAEGESASDGDMSGGDAAAPPPSGDNETSTAMMADDNGSSGADAGSGTDLSQHAGDTFWDETGILAILLVLTSALLVFIAWSTRRRARTR